MSGLHGLSAKWQKLWDEARVFECSADSRKKFFVNFPYPYINSYLHLGHAFSVTRVDVLARFRRMQGFNVLFPQSWHCTGTPVWAAAQRVREKEPKQLKILESLGFRGGEIEEFCEVKHWIDVFVPAAEEDLRSLGASVDWRRSFITTDLNPRYDRFIRWQFRKLKEKGYVAKGQHPVVWCPKDGMPVGDHDRVEGEGEVPQEFTLLKFRFGDSYLVAATLRPETVFGQTNLWVNPGSSYVRAKVDGETWIVSRECSEKLAQHGRAVEVLESFKGSAVIGKRCFSDVVERELPVFPAGFVSPDVGTGVVTSVPSDAPYDYVALLDLAADKVSLKRYGISASDVDVKPIPIIGTKEYGDLSAVSVVKKMGIKNQSDKRLDEATGLVYRAGFYSGRMNSNCGRYAGMPVEKAKELIKKELAGKGFSDRFYEATGKVVCRCLTQCVVKVVSDQWFLKYGDRRWKDETRTALDRMKLYPELVRTQFNHVIEWLNDWACTHHHGTGTRLPWDDKWVIESLSDSTVYMAYYTIAHLIKDVSVDDVSDELFDYVFLGRGKGGREWDSMRREFEYWYPLDVRSSGKDLIQNHLSFALFNHVAVFPEKYWPRAFSVNGWLLVEGEKMSKSKGNFFTIREVVGKYSADVTRASLMLGGEGLNDPNFDLSTVKALSEKLQGWLSFIKNNYREASGSNARTLNDRILLSVMNRSVKEGTESMEDMLFRTAFEKLFFQMQKALKDYLKGPVNQEVLNSFIDVQTRVISPFCPFVAEEAWSMAGREGFVSVAAWPRHDVKLMDREAESFAEYSDGLRKDIYAVLDLIKVKPSSIMILVSQKWKYRLCSIISEVKGMDVGRVMKSVSSSDIKSHSKEAAQIVQKLMRNPGLSLLVNGQEAEMGFLAGLKDGLEKEFKCRVSVSAAEDSQDEKARQALPGKPAVVVK
ncbi:leucine--tRNA ligase [Candidatus Woesearchaeota archaeon]|nr:leucine--tRNA ligase [Candidatus Woesearchaeota archaeon]